jgi:hypothetical protein
VSVGKADAGSVPAARRRLVDRIAAGVGAGRLEAQHALVRQVVHLVPAASPTSTNWSAPKTRLHALVAGHLDLRGVEAAVARDLLVEAEGADLVRVREQVPKPMTGASCGIGGSRRSGLSAA